MKNLKYLLLLPLIGSGCIGEDHYTIFYAPYFKGSQALKMFDGSTPHFKGKIGQFKTLKECQDYALSVGMSIPHKEGDAEDAFICAKGCGISPLESTNTIRCDDEGTDLYSFEEDGIK